ncbi:glutaredoxin-like protein NrdH [Bacillus mesophilus]|uniref:Glutaredoxin family protein n=1 Tax=Bacillus mesophilus TaxID=1808955 RepID=A0A6M0Q7Z6_9BACI|nr:glutaredoxin family protein [Bacillus mesophilus]MBM7662164.1 glutaredoxin-like protein NrdH [Bacillus mesophilus]NEY72485.1 glutaredoxin family protein [Bacillus mesophilus]
MYKKVIVYTSSDCVECTYVKQMLTDVGVSFESRDITSNQEFQREVEKFGFMGVPVTVVGDTAIKGFTLELVEIIESLKHKE